MTKKQKKVLYRIIVAAILLVAVNLIPVSGYWKAILFLIPYLVIGYDILRKAVLGIIHGEVFDENFLMAVATVGAMILGEYSEGVAVMLFYQIGELFQAVAVGKSRRNITALMDIRPDYANVEDADGDLEQVDPDDVEIGSIIVVRPGEKVPIDGVVAEGSSTLNTSALTGESVPREVGCGDDIISGCININGLLKIRTTKEFEESTVSKILELVENSSMKKSCCENFITKFARYYTPAVCYSALALAILPPVINLLLGNPANWSTWVIRALTFLVISCPCALVISIPLSFFGGIGGASACGILVKGSNYLEALAQTKYVVFDKTGTLTKGVFQVVRIEASEEFKETCKVEKEKVTTEDATEEAVAEPANSELLLEKTMQQLLRYAAHAESFSNHPISKSLREAYGKDIDNTRVTDIEEISGHGVKAKVDGVLVAAGNAKLMQKLGLNYAEDTGIGTVVHVAVDGVYAGYILIADVEKETAAQAVAALKVAGVKKTVMLTGDSKQVAEHVAESLGVDEVHSELLPADKVERVEQLLAQKSKKEMLAFVGDGINDAPVLSRADIGIAMGALGSDAAIEAADIVLMDDNPEKIALAMRISRKCLRIVYQNIVFALGVKGLCLILGALGIANMWVAIFADVGVMVLAVLNAIRCLKVDK
ncbi:MAG: heavy metal translocating P-type ATPase [Lachnospiraceae bacterium]|nr:heavy metal translocating P-type ATPase [Lachnospiraceae bacterium]